MKFLFLLFLCSFNSASFAATCSLEPTEKLASIPPDFARVELAKAKKECKTKLFKEGSPRDSQHACACNHYSGPLTDRDIFDSRFAAEIKAVKKQFSKETKGDAVKEKKLVEDLYANYLKAKYDLPCGNDVGIFPNRDNSETTNNAGMYCANDSKSAAAMKIPDCNNNVKPGLEQASRAAVTKELKEAYAAHKDPLSEQFVCNTIPINDNNSFLVSETDPPCALDFSKKFMDNDISYQSGATDQSVMKEIEASDCYKRTQHEETIKGKTVTIPGLTVDHIEIETSSSLLANTNEAVNKTFQTLSNERARKIENDVFKNISGFKSAKYEEKTDADNKDGTSGPCPYTFVKDPKGKNPNWQRDDKITDDQLEKFKYVRAKIYYVKKTKPLSGTGSRLHLGCSTVKFGCNSKDALPSTSFKKPPETTHLSVLG